MRTHQKLKICCPNETARVCDRFICNKINRLEGVNLVILDNCVGTYADYPFISNQHRMPTNKFSMKRITGSIFTFGGLALLIYTGINYLNNSESFSMLGMDVVVSQGNIVPVVISAIVLLIGIILLVSKN